MEEKVKCNCGKDGVSGYCPYQNDVNNKDPKDCECNCCDECRHQCAMDI